jgi:hypothetical protein
MGSKILSSGEESVPSAGTAVSEEPTKLVTVPDRMAVPLVKAVEVVVAAPPSLSTGILAKRTSGWLAKNASPIRLSPHVV